MAKINTYRFKARPDERGWEILTLDDRIMLIDADTSIIFQGTKEELLELLWKIRDAAYHEWGNEYLNEPIEEY